MVTAFSTSTTKTYLDGHSTEVDLRPFRHTEMGNAQRFAALYKDKVRYVHERRKWLVWDGTRWRPDELSTIVQMAKYLVRAMYVQAGVVGDVNFSGALSEWATKCESAARLESMLRLAQSEPEIAISQTHLDTNPWLVNCLNGTLDLQTGELRPHNQNDLITRRVNVDYNPDAKAPTWDTFLRKVFADDLNLIAYVQRAVGYTLTGLTTDHVLFYLLGGGRNGKSTFIETIVDLLAEYSVRLRTESLVLRDGGGGIPNDVAALAGMRVCVTDETEQDQRMAEKTVKALTGGDEIRARFLHQEFFTFKPSHTLWMFGNHKLSIRGTDTGIWKRIKLIPFNVTISEAERDPYLKDKLRAELPGILAWAVEGCLDWNMFGLGTANAVETATDSYRAEMDVIGDWLKTCYTTDANGREKIADVYRSYEQFMTEAGERAISKRRLCVLLRERGMTIQGYGAGGWDHVFGVKSRTIKADLSTF